MQQMTAMIPNGNKVVWMPVTTTTNNLLFNAQQSLFTQSQIQHPAPQMGQFQGQLYQLPVQHGQPKLPAQAPHQATPSRKRTYAKTSPPSAFGLPKKRKITSYSKGQAKISSRQINSPEEIPCSLENASEVLRKRYYKKSKRGPKPKVQPVPVRQPKVDLVNVQNIPNFLDFQCPMMKDIDGDSVCPQKPKNIPQPESIVLPQNQSSDKLSKQGFVDLTKETGVSNNKTGEELFDFSKALGLQLAPNSQDLVDEELQKPPMGLGIEGPNSATKVSQHVSFSTKNPENHDTVLDEDLFELTNELGIVLSDSLTRLISKQAHSKSSKISTEELNNILHPVTGDYVFDQKLIKLNSETGLELSESITNMISQKSPSSNFLKQFLSELASESILPSDSLVDHHWLDLINELEL